MSAPSRVIRIAAALIDREDGRVLLVRKRGTRFFMQPGGKIDAGELPIQALIRELREELGWAATASELVHLGRYSAVAANELGATVDAELFSVSMRSEPVPAAEIEEALWVDPDAHDAPMIAPLTRDVILPLHRRLRGARGRNGARHCKEHEL